MEITSHKACVERQLSPLPELASNCVLFVPTKTIFAQKSCNRRQKISIFLQMTVLLSSFSHCQVQRYSNNRFVFPQLHVDGSQHRLFSIGSQHVCKVKGTDRDSCWLIQVAVQPLMPNRNVLKRNQTFITQNYDSKNTHNNKSFVCFLLPHENRSFTSFIG